jgi:hypothetical protein
MNGLMVDKSNGKWTPTIEDVRRDMNKIYPDQECTFEEYRQKIADALKGQPADRIADKNVSPSV